MKRRPIWKFLFIAAGVILALVGAAALWIRSTADRKFAVLEERLRALREEAHAPDTARRPGTESGNAWDDYSAALLEASKMRSDADKLVGILAGTMNADVAFGDAALAAHGSSVDLLLRGAGRSTCVPPRGNTGIDLWQWDKAARLAMLKARNLAKEGKTAEAVEIRLALCQFARDLSESGNAYAPGFNFSGMEWAFEELRGDLSSASTPAPVIAGIESRLELLDAAFPRSEKLRRQRLRYLGQHYTGIVEYSGLYGSLVSWRFGYSTRLMAARAFEHWEHWCTRSAEADRLPWSEAQPLIAGIRAEIDRTHFLNQASDIGGSFLDDGSAHRTARVHLRLLRTAAHYRRTGEILELEDPFGTKLLHSESQGRLKVWSVGLDGVDQGGKGTWYSRPIEDVVLDVPR